MNTSIPIGNGSLGLRLIVAIGFCIACSGCNPNSKTRLPVSNLNQPTIEEFVTNEPISPIFKDPRLEESKVSLGKALFHDKRLSKENSISCGDCHRVSQGGADGRVKAVGYKQRVGSLNTPTVFNSSLSIAQFWDGRVDSLEEQVSGPIHSPKEMATNWDEVVAKLQEDSGFNFKFERIYESPISPELIVDAIVTYEKALLTVNSPFDQYLMGDDGAISDAAKDGYRLFKKIGCISCHQGKAVGGNMFQTFGIMKDYFAEKPFSQSDRGRFNVTHRDTDLHRFKVPSLRNAVDTAPYFHDGSAKTLNEAVAKMAKFQLGTSLNEDEIANIVEFIASLNSEVAEHLQ